MIIKYVAPTRTLGKCIEYQIDTTKLSNNEQAIAIEKLVNACLMLAYDSAKPAAASDTLIKITIPKLNASRTFSHPYSKDAQDPTVAALASYIKKIARYFPI